MMRVLLELLKTWLRGAATIAVASLALWALNRGCPPDPKAAPPPDWFVWTMLVVAAVAIPLWAGSREDDRR